MKVPQWFVPKKRLIKVAQERTQEKLQYVNIDNSIKESDRKVLSGYQESLARFAQRHNIAVDFKKADGNNNTRMNIYKTSLNPHAVKRQRQGLWYFATPEYKASTGLPKTNDTNFYNSLKTIIKSLADTTTEPTRKEKFPQRIRHENKYYNWEQ